MTTTLEREQQHNMKEEIVEELRSQLRGDMKDVIEDLVIEMRTMEDEKKKKLKTIDTEMTLGEFVKQKRKENGYTLETLSKMVDCSVVYLHQIEKGKCKNISMKVFRNICRALNYSADNLLEYLILEDSTEETEK